LVREDTFVTHFIRKLRGGSQPLLIEASDGITYVLKFSNNPQGCNVAFNEAIGTELYSAAGLPVPKWKPLRITEDFLNETPQCWFETADGSLKPQAGLCFGSQYLGSKESRLWEILPRSSFPKIANKSDFYLAWLLDVCARHTDDREALFEEQVSGIRAVFIDHGHMFSGPGGKSSQPRFLASAYLDTRIYGRCAADYTIANVKNVLKIDVDRLWKRAGQQPIEWLTDTALQNLAACLCVIANAKAVQSNAELIAGYPVEKDKLEFLPYERTRACPDRLLRPGIQGA
jgi:hypothetical protein